MRTNAIRTALVAAGVLLIAASVVFQDASAIPAFARKYDMSCSTCHSPFPKLKPYGDDFAANGFQLEGKEPPRFTRDTGDDLLYLMRELPVALRLEGYFRYQPQTTGKGDFQTPYLFKLLSGGQITRDVSYFFYFFFGERGEVAGLEDAFITFNNVFGSELDISVGQFQVSDPLFKRELRLPFEDYQVYSTEVGYASPTLTYDRGLMFTYDLPTSTSLVLEVLNGNGIGAADAGRSFDDDKNKNGLFRISQDLGDMVRIGGFGYYGNQYKYGVTNRTTMLGPDLTFSFDRFELNLQYLERKDTRPYFSSLTRDQRTRGGFGELIFSPEGDKSRWYGVLLYNWVRSDLKVLDYESATAHLSYLFVRNLRLTAEYTYDIHFKENRYTVGFVSAF